MPLAKDRGGVADVAQNLGDGDFRCRERDVGPLDRNQRQSGTDGIASSHQRGARRCAGRLDQKLRQPQTFRGEPVNARRRRSAQLPAAVDAEVAVAGIVGKNEKDVRLLLLRGCGGDRYASEQCQQTEPDVPAHVHRFSCNRVRPQTSRRMLGRIGTGAAELTLTAGAAGSRVGPSPGPRDLFEPMHSADHRPLGGAEDRVVAAEARRGRALDGVRVLFMGNVNLDFPNGHHAPRRSY
jgi:hypothetical protein